MQQKLIFTALAICLFNAYSVCGDTSRWPVVGEDICNTAIKMYDPFNAKVAATLWVSSFGAPGDYVTFARQLLEQLERTDSVHDALGNALENNRQVVHAQLSLCIDENKELHAWGWVQDNKICTAVTQR